MPFLERLVLGVVGGAVLGIFVAIVNISDGKPFGDAVTGFFSGIMVGTALILYWTRDKGADTYASPGDDEVAKLRYDLQTAHHYAASYSADGKHHDAAYWKSQIAVIESQLRSRGA
jgi:hypothetical protein